MKKSLIALASVAALGAAHADVTLYGILDANVTSTNHGVANDPNAGFSATPLPAVANGQSGQATNRVTGMGSGGLGISRWGISGIDKESGATFKLESPINMAFGTNPNGRISDAYAQGTSVNTTSTIASQEGSSDGQMFSREATIGLTGSMGTFTVGRQTTVMADAVGAYDNVGGAFSPLGFNGGYSGAGFTGEARWDQSMKYEYDFAPNMRLLAGYALGGSSNSFSTGSAFSVGLKYTVNSNLNFTAIYQANKDAILAAAPYQTVDATHSPMLALRFADTHANGVFVEWQATSKINVKGGLENIVIGTPSNPTYDNTTTILSNVAVGSVDVTKYQVPEQQNLYYATVKWMFAPTWETNLGIYQRHDSSYGTSAAQAACSTTYSTACAASTATYLAMDVRKSLSKQTDLYASFATTTLTGPGWGATAATAVLPVTSEMMGLRVKF